MRSETEYGMRDQTRMSKRCIWRGDIFYGTFLFFVFMIMNEMYATHLSCFIDHKSIPFMHLFEVNVKCK